MPRHRLTFLTLLILLLIGSISACSKDTAPVTPSPSETQLSFPATPRLTATVPSSPTYVTPTLTATATPTPLVSEETTARQLRVFTQLWEAVRDEYLYPDFNGLDWDEVRVHYRVLVEAGIDDEAFYEVMREMIGALGDDHSAFISPQEVAEEEAQLSGQLDYVGIGIYMTALPEKGYAVLLQVFPDSPAEGVGLQPHDHILAVDGVPAFDENGVDQLDLLLGPKGSEVRVTVQTPGQDARELEVERTRLQTQLPVDAYRLPGTDVGYVMIPTFWDQTVAGRVRQGLEGLLAEDELDGLVVDMRINGGGSGTALIDTLALFTQGEVGVFVSRDGEDPLFIEADPVGDLQELPLAVLVGRETESFGEVFSGVLQESRGAFVVGRTTVGNVETLGRTDFEDGSRAWIAVETFRPPSGTNWEETGIVPDIEIPLDWDEFTAQDDPQLDAAVEWLLQSRDG